MSDLARRFAEDKALRDSALQLLKSDLALIRGELDERGVGARAKDRLGEAALGMLDDAIDYADDNKGWVAAGTAAVVLWFARKPILRWLADLLDGDGHAEPGAPDARSADDTDSTGDLQ
ncbi:MAG TPA: hypothetical protein VI168_09935 [Croceibacterium sp.]